MGVLTFFKLYKWYQITQRTAYKIREAWISPFKIDYGRKPNDLWNEEENYNNTLQVSSTIGATQEDYEDQVKQAAKWRKKASNADGKLSVITYA